MTAQVWAPRILAGFADGSPLRIPLGVFYSTALRRALERDLAERGGSPQWDEAKQSFDDVGRLVRIVPVVRVERAQTVDDGWTD